MAGSIGRFFKSLVYAGLKPAPHGAPPPRGRFRKFWDRLLTGGPSPNDPLYLTNRTWKQKLRLGLVVSTPVLIVVGLAAYALFSPPALTDQAPSQPTVAEIAARTAILPQDFSLTQNTDLQVAEVTVEKGARTAFVVGALKNNTAQRFTGADVSFDLTDETGSQVGAAAGRTGALEPHATVPFRIPIPHRNAQYVLVREVRGLL